MIDSSVWRAIEQGLPSYLDRQRWYADKFRSIRSLSPIDIAVVKSAFDPVLLSIVSIDFHDGGNRRYFLPMAVLSNEPPQQSMIATGERDGQPFWIQDGPSSGVFRDFLAEASSGRVVEGMHGRFEFESWELDGYPFILDPDMISSAAAFEQSNSSIVFGSQAIAKLYRRLETGQNIEVDMNRYLAVDARFESLPKLLGAITYVGPDGAIPLGLIQVHAGEHRDCWTALIGLLRGRDLASLQVVERLGTVTGEMHVALSAAPPDSPMSPVAVSTVDIAEWKANLQRSVEETASLVNDRLRALPDRSRIAAQAYLSASIDWNDRCQGFDTLIGTYKTRVHGDYHLGQVLLTSDGRLLVVDFEGEPQRPASERAAKYSPLKDVAGMLRSLTYAAGMAASDEGISARPDTNHWFQDWERRARGRFLRAYREAISVATLPLSPHDDRAFERAVVAFESDKALYEIRYELNSRPDWAWLPLESMEPQDTP